MTEYPLLPDGTTPEYDEGFSRLFESIESIEAYFSAEHRTGTMGQKLFWVGENPHLFILLSGSVGILSPVGGTFRESWRIEKGGIIGEGILFGKTHKEVEGVIVSHEATYLELSREDIDRLEREAPNHAATFYRYLVRISNERVNTASKELGILYEIGGYLTGYTSRGPAWLTLFLQALAKLLDIPVLFFVERHPTVESLFIYRFDSRFPSTRVYEKAGAEIQENLDGEVSGEKTMFRGIPDTYYLHIVPLHKADILKGFIFLASATPIDTYKLRIIRNLSGNIAEFVEIFQKGCYV